LLSDIFESNTAECAEIAALAQAYLQQESITSTYFSGDVLWNKDTEFSEEHSFLIVRDGEKVYIYDPTNPTNTTQGKFPSIYTTQANFEEETRKDEKRFITTQNLISRREAYYGVNNGSNIIAEEHII
jgi:outer membrane lipoprotein-sorting protein